MSRVSALVTVRVEVEVTVGNWNGDASFSSLEEQALREGRHKIAVALTEKNGFRVIGEAKRMRVELQADPS